MSLNRNLAVASLLGISIFTTIYLYNVYSKKDEVVEVEELWVYPVKSCKGIKLKKANITKFGFQYDREFMLVDTNNKFTSQRSYPKMALIETIIDEQSNVLLLKYGENVFQVSLSRSSNLPTIEVTVWGDKCDAVDVGGTDATKFFSEHIEIPNMRLVRMAPTYKRPTESKYAPLGQSSFSDGFPFLLLSRESLNELNSR